MLLEMKDIEKCAQAADNIFEERIRPLLTPLSVGPTHPFPTLITGRLYLAVGLKSAENNRFLEKSDLSFVEIPSNVTGRFIRTDKEMNYIPVENVIRYFIGRLFQGYEVTSAHVIRITRDADFSLQEDGASDLLNEIESTIKKMHRRSVIKIEHETDIPAVQLDKISGYLSIGPEDRYAVSGLLNHRDLMSLYEVIEREDMKYEKVNPVYPEAFRNRDIFKVIDDGDRLLFHPYHSYDPVVELLNRAADDPDVLVIKQTLYRTSSDSGIIRALVKAAENGKYVSVIDELRARFDEKRNIEWARKLEEAGAHVIYGVKGLKTHAKALLIVRRDPESGGIRRYVHLGTGNYNETTAMQYTDFSLFTSDEKTGEDISAMFNLLTGFSYTEQWDRITLAPIGLRNKFVSLIRRETDNARKGIKASITAKMNSLSDPEIIRELYEASRAGVKIRLIVRGICCLIPGIKGTSENISVISIVGRYLEHSRVFSFHNAGEKEYYLSSADWMNRNMDRRVEVLFPVLDEENRAFIRSILDLQFDDTVNSRTLGSDLDYRTAAAKTSGKKNSFEEMRQLVKKREMANKGNSPVSFEPERNGDL
jgi:polyphosphate kinase